MTPLQLGKYSNYKKQYSKDIIFMESKNAKINNVKKQEYNELKAIANELYNDCIEVEISKGLKVTFYKKRLDMLSIQYYWIDHTGDLEWLPKSYPNINEYENNFDNEEEAINWLKKQRELDKDFGNWQHFKLEKIYLL